MLRRARIVVGTTFSLYLLGAETAVFFQQVLPAQPGALVVVVFAFALALTLLIPVALRRSGSVVVAANLVLAASYAVMLTIFCLLGGIDAPVLHWCALLPMLAVLMGTRGSALAWAGIAFGTLLVFMLADRSGWPLPSYLDESELLAARHGIQRLVDVGSWIAILLTIALIYERHKGEQTRELATTNAELTREISHRERAEQRIRYLAYYDELTTLPNREFFKERLAQAMQQAKRDKKSTGVLFLDLDDFKGINDTLGHDFGDLLLREVATRLTGCVRSVDSISRFGRVDDAHCLVSRLGGDEFTVLLVGIRGNGEAGLVARRILRSFELPFSIQGRETFVTASIGVAVSQNGVESLEELLKNADLAMYHAKESGQNAFCFFEESLKIENIKRRTVSDDLRGALERGEFALQYQPIVEAATRRVVCVEALLRWNHPVRGLVPPLEFIEIAEQTGLIVPIGEWVLRQACAQTRQWQRAVHSELHVAVNVSAVQFKRAGLVALVEAALRDSSLPSHCLVLEITESAIMADEAQVAVCLGKLKQRGVGIALDDFGTGYSSLSYLKRFPVDILKLDRSFVHGIDANSEVQAIASAIIAMAHELDLLVVAEGVETEAEDRFLLQRGCDRLQGYRFGRPCPPDQLSDRLAGSRDGGSSTS